MGEYIENDKQDKKKTQYTASRPSITIPIGTPRISIGATCCSTRISWISVPHNMLLFTRRVIYLKLRNIGFKRTFLFCPPLVYDIVDIGLRNMLRNQK